MFLPKQQVADGLTKALPKDRFITFRRSVELEMENDKDQWGKNRARLDRKL